MERQENMGKDGLLHCSVCGEPTQKILPFPLMDGSEGTRDMKVHIMCSCEKKERDAYDREQKRQEEMRVVEGLRKLSLMDDKLSQARLESFTETDDNARLLKIVRNYIVNFEKMYEDNQGLLLWGPVGTGKSYAAAVIANELLDRRTSVVMTSFIKILKEVGTFDDDNGKIEKMNQSKLLIIDDLGAERGTDYSLERVYDIIDSRYRSNKPIILTTNLTMEQMKNCEDIRDVLSGQGKRSLLEKKGGGISICSNQTDIGGMKMLKMIAEISIAKLEDRKTVTAILHENGYTVGPGKRKKTETGKTIDYFLKVYREDGSDE